MVRKRQAAELAVSRRKPGWRAIARRILAEVVALVALAYPAVAQQAPPPIQPGTTPDTALVLPGITDEFHGVAAEHAYLAAHFPDWHIEYQKRVTVGARDYDMLGMIEPDRTKVTIFFDISDWIGK